MTARKANRRCPYCGCDISGMGRGYRVCLKPECREKFEADQKARKNKQSLEWCRRNRSFKADLPPEPLNGWFCQYCGNNIQSTSEAVSVPPTSTYTAPAVTSQIFIEDTSPGPHSKKCLAFSIVSLAMVVATLEIGSSLRLFYILGMPLPLFITGLVINIIINIMGLMFGIFSRTNGKEAAKSEPDNTVEKIGSIFAIFGIIGHSILLIVGVIILVVALIFL